MEIVAIFVALAIPILVFAVIFTPGALGVVMAFALQPGWREAIFFGGAFLVFLILAYRIYRRIRPRGRPQPPQEMS